MIWKYLQVGGVVLVLVLLASIVFAWKASQVEQAKLQTELKASQQLLAAANERQKNRDTTLNEVLGQLAKQKASVRTPDQVVKALPDMLPLPIPLTLSESEPTTTSKGEPQGKESVAKSSLPISAPEAKVMLPAADLKPLYDFSVECKACQAKLAASEADLKDEKVKTATLGRERDSALQAARGGSVVRRIVRAAKWFVIGAAAGAVAAKLAH